MASAATPKAGLANGHHSNVSLGLPRLRPLFQGICIGILIGVVYSLSMWYIVTQLLPIVISFEFLDRRSTGPSIANSTWIPRDSPSLPGEAQRIRWLMALWESSPLLNYPMDPGDPFLREAEMELANVSLAPPHLENCAAKAREYKRLDSRGPSGSRPIWSLWKGQIALLDDREERVEVEGLEELIGDKTRLVWGPFPPWIEGADEDNLPMTRRAQRDIWLLQHPPDCNDPSIKFLAPHWSDYAHYGLGAQIHHMTGIFSVAMKERRVLVMQDFNRAGHRACGGLQYRRWSCYFLPETTHECRLRAEKLLNDPQAILDGRVWLEQHIPSSYNVWMGEPTDLWGKPWDHMQPTMEIEGELYTKLHQYRDVRWWRSQALRYLMRFPSEYTCLLMNKARHEAFGLKAAAQVIRSADQTWLGQVVEEQDMEKWVWKNQKPWVPRPLVNVHVRIGDKASEMKMVGFEGYMDLAKRLRKRFPHVKDIWLSTEMQNVVDASKNYTGWNFYYTLVPRQGDGTSMASYLASLGPERASSNSFVNFLMASDSDYFIGALGSSWCYLIDSMRSTGGKLGSGYLSVNVDRFWKKKRRRKLLQIPPIPVLGSTNKNRLPMDPR